VGGRFEIRTMDPVPNETLRSCGFQDPLFEEDWEFSWERLSNVARCITSKHAARVTFRELNAASFIERDR